MKSSSKRLAMRQAKLDALGPKPRWWRVPARRRYALHFFMKGDFSKQVRDAARGLDHKKPIK